MTRRTRVLTSVSGIATLSATALLSVVCGRDAHAEPPNILIVLDTSVSMGLALDNTPANCEGGKPSRYALAAQALTGSINNAWCRSGSPIGEDDTIGGVGVGGANCIPPVGYAGGDCQTGFGSPSSSSNNGCTFRTCPPGGIYGGYQWCEEATPGDCAADVNCAPGCGGSGSMEFTNHIPLGNELDDNHVCAPAPRKASNPWGDAKSKPGSWKMAGSDHPIGFFRIHGGLLSNSCDPTSLADYWNYDPECASIDFHDHEVCDFGQNSDGILDQYSDRARFGLATTDSLQAYPGNWANIPAMHSLPWTDPDRSESIDPDLFSYATHDDGNTIDKDEWMPWMQLGDGSYWQYSYWYNSTNNYFDAGNASTGSLMAWIKNLENFTDLPPPNPSSVAVQNMIDLINGWGGIAGRIGGTGTPPNGAYGNTLLLNPTFNEVWTPRPLANPTPSTSTCPRYTDRSPANLPSPTPQAANFAGCMDNYDIGIKNPWAAPWMGRLMGFGLSTQTTTQFSGHNEMIQLAILAAGPYGRDSSPLGATMRDVHEFMRKDVKSTGAQYPDEDPVTYISPEQDTFTNQLGCRTQSVVLITDGRTHRDIGEPPWLHASNLRLDVTGNRSEVKTHVIGVMPTLFQDPVGTTRDCSLFDPSTPSAEFAPGGYCDTVLAAASTATNVAGKACCTVHKTASWGGTTKATIATTQLQIAGALGTVVSGAQDEIVARTVPVFAKSTGVFAGTTAPAVSYEVFSGMNMKSSSIIWPGFLHRLRKVCSGATAVTADVLPALGTPSPKGDKFQDNICPGGACGPNKTLTNKRKFWTVVTPADDTKYGREGTIRPAGSNAIDGIASSPGVQTSMIDMSLAGAFRDEIETKWAVGKETHAWLGMASSSGGDDDDDDDDDDDAIDRCEDLFGVTGSDQAKLIACSDYLLRWQAGQAVNGRQRASALGAIWRTNPVMVAPPEPNIPDSSFSADIRTGAQAGNPSFVQQQKERPTMLYAQTIDGLLHAFVVENNTVAGDTVMPYRHNDIPEADDGENNELWSFMPPAVARELWPSFEIHSRQLDGPMTVRDVVFRRTASDRRDLVGNWHTVLVASGGDSDAGGFYYALDITNPLTPVFLWQLKLAAPGNPPVCPGSKGKKGKKCKMQPGDGQPLFGAATTGATITTLRIIESGNTNQVAVAILPGGYPVDTPTTSANRRWSPVGETTWTGAYSPRSKVTDWGSSNRYERSVTVVELETGKVLGRMVGENNDHYANATAAVKVPFAETKFDSPMVGTAVVFPDYPGEPATRAYIGDADGTVWRLDFSNANPLLWKARIAWDAYSDGSLKGASSAKILGTSTSINWGGTPAQQEVLAENIELNPVISVDENGDPVVMFATGDQELFKQRTAGAVNFLVAFGDPFTAGNYTPKLRAQVAYTDGDRVTGPAALFDGKLFASHYVPGALGTCLEGEGGWCAFDYNDKASEGTAEGQVPNDGFPDAVADLGGLPPLDVCYDLPAQESAFGISLFQKPSCELAKTDFDDVWFGGQSSSYNTTNSGTYQLVMETGKGGSSEDDLTLNTAHRDLAAPNTATRIVSWTNVVE